MQIKAKVEDAQLIVSVSFTNDSAETIYLKNWLWDWYDILGIDSLSPLKSPKTARPTRELAYPCAGAPHELVLLNGDGPSFPPGISPTVPRIPECTRLGTGESYHGLVRVPLPILEWSAYTAPASHPAHPVDVQTIRYRLESLRESVCRQRPVAELANFSCVFQARGYPSDVHEASVQLPKAITLYRRSDVIARFG